MKFGTKAIHGGMDVDPAAGAIMPPIYQTSTYVQQSPGVHKGYVYSRTHNPTRSALEKNLAMLENARYALSFSSGLAAADAVMKLLKPGDEVIANHDLYGGTYRLFTRVFSKYGIVFHFISMQDTEALKRTITGRTKLIWLETPTNPMLYVIDIGQVAAVAQSHKAYLVVDNTFATPYLQNPLDLGAHIAMHSLTKYIGGHSDVIMGALMCSDHDLYEQLSFIQYGCGAVPAPLDCFLVLRGIKTLHVRMERHCENARAVAEFLTAHPKVREVFWPGLPSHPNHEVARKQMRGFGGMLSFRMKDDSAKAAMDLSSRTKIIKLAESLGGVESLIGHPASMTHAAIPAEERRKSGVTDTLLRLSIGIEDADDLIEDLRQAIG